MRKLPGDVCQRIELRTHKNDLTECHDQAGIGGKIDNLLNTLSSRSVEANEDSEDGSKTTDENEREDREPTAAYQDAQLPPLGVVERIVGVAGGNRNSSDFTNGIDKLEVAIRRLWLVRKTLLWHLHVVCYHVCLCMIHSGCHDGGSSRCCNGKRSGRLEMEEKDQGGVSAGTKKRARGLCNIAGKDPSRWRGVPRWRKKSHPPWGLVQSGGQSHST